MTGCLPDKNLRQTWALCYQIGTSWCCSYTPD